MRERTWAPGSIAVLDCLMRPGGPMITAEARLVYLALFSYMGDNYTCRPKVETLAQGCGLADRTVQRRMEELEVAGLVSSNRDELAKKGAGRKNSATYRLFPPWAPGPKKKPKGDGESPIQKGDSVTPMHKGDSVTPEGRQADATRVTESQPLGDRETPQETQWSNPLEKPNEETRVHHEDARRLWAMAVAQVQRKAGGDSWVGNAKLIKVEESTWFVLVGGDFARDRIESRYGQEFRRLIALQAPDVILRFVTEKDLVG